MYSIILFVVFLVAGFVLMERSRSTGRINLRRGAMTCFILAPLMLLGTSFVVVKQDSIGQLKRIYLGSSMKTGQIIAFDGENGPQARILGPGFKTESCGPF